MGYKSSINPNTLRIPQLIAIRATPVPVPLSSPMANQRPSGIAMFECMYIMLGPQGYCL